MPDAFQQTRLLSAPLDRKHVKERKQGGRTVSYIEGWHAIAEANRIFGFHGWDRETVEMRMVMEQERKLAAGPNGWQVAYVAKVRLYVKTDKGMTFREGTGYGSGIDRDLGAAHESAVKEAETDAMKRALMTFGNPFGLPLYDKLQADVVDEAGEARADYKMLVGLFGKAKTPDEVGKLWEGNAETVAKIKKHGGDAALDALNKIAQARVDELRASA